MNLSGVKGDNNTAGFNSFIYPGGKFVFKVLAKKDPTLYVIKIDKQQILIRTNKTLKIGKTYSSEELVQFNQDKSNPFLDTINLREEISGHPPLQLLLLEIITNQFFRSNTDLGAEIEKLLKNLTKNRLKTARYMALLADKGIKLDLNSLNLISELPGESSSENLERRDPGKREKKEKNRIKEEVKIQCNTASEEPSFLGLLNHIKAESQNWILIPIKLSDTPQAITGRIKLQLGDREGITKLIVEIDRKEGNVVFLVQDPLGKNARCRMIIQESRVPKTWRREIYRLKEKLQNLGVKFDDIKEEVQYFDGFDYYDREDYKSVDTRV